MPLYDYDCPGCGQTFEKRVKFSDDADAVACPLCGNGYTERKLSRIAVHGKSSGSSASSAPVSIPSGGL